jgi:hypothetical protein
MIGNGIGPIGCVHSNESACRPNPCIDGVCQVVEGCTEISVQFKFQIYQSVTAADYVCHCHYGYTGRNCELTTPCLSSPCLNGGQCVPETLATHGYRCDCASDWIGHVCEEHKQGGEGTAEAEMFRLRRSCVWMEWHDRLSTRRRQIYERTDVCVDARLDYAACERGRLCESRKPCVKLFVLGLSMELSGFFG